MVKNWHKNILQVQKSTHDINSLVGVQKSTHDINSLVGVQKSTHNINSLVGVQQLTRYQLSGRCSIINTWYQ